MQPDQPVLSGATESTSSIPPDEHAQMLEGQGIRARFERSQAPSASSHIGGSQPWAAAGTVPNQTADNPDPPIHGEAHHGPDVRIIVTTSTREVTVHLHPLGHTGPVEAPAILDDVAGGESTASPGGPSYQKLSVTQSKRDIGMAIKARSLNDDALLLLNCDLFFDPVADRIAIRNKNSTMVKVQLIVEASGDGCEQDVPRAREIEVNGNEIELLDAGNWEVLTGPGVHVLDFTILPRRHVEIVKGPPQLGPKRVRTIEDEDEPSVHKKGRLAKAAADADESGTETIVFQPAPLSLQRTFEAGGVRIPPRHALRAAPEQELAPASLAPLMHPMEDLKAGDVARVISGCDEDYTLTFEKRIELRSSCQVFSAQHSAVPAEGGNGSLAVIKVIRSNPIRAEHSADVAKGVVRAAELWLNEVKKHRKVSRHAQTSVVRLFDADARFLSIYMEHVQAPSLGDRIYRSNGHMCNLDKADAVRVLYDISSALRYIHSQGIVHNDVKPGNILYSPHSRLDRGAVLIDFGLSSETDGKHLNTGGTPWYIPPEFMGTEESDGRKGRTRGRPGDVFALGVVILFLRRKLPFPEMCRYHPQWQIAEVFKGSKQASEAMRNWLGYVERSSEKLDGSCHLENTVGLMVETAVRERIELGTVCEMAVRAWAKVA